MMNEDDDAGFEPFHTSSPTDHVLTELQLYGYRPFQDEPDPRPLPEGNTVAAAVADIFDALVSTLGTASISDLSVDGQSLPRAADRVERELDDNEREQHQRNRWQRGPER